LDVFEILYEEGFAGATAKEFLCVRMFAPQDFEFVLNRLALRNRESGYAQRPARCLAGVKHVVRVVSIEGPIHESEIVLRIRSAWGLARAGNRIRDAVQAAIKAAKRKGDIAGGPFYLVPGQAVVVRNRSDVESNTLRKPEILPPEEVRVAIAEVVEKNYGAERDQLVQAVARLFGFGSTSAQLREVVETALTDLLDAGRLRLEGRLVTRAQLEATSV
jgi:Protein of unknown function (DUF3320)